jgi:hypothetical protein
MQNTNQVNLPKNVDELKNAIKLAIEHFQGSPVKNLNKLNESTAISLNFKNYDQLAPLLTNTESLLTPIQVERGYGQNYYISVDAVIINEMIFDEEIVDYNIIERTEEITDLYTWIAETKSDSDRVLMKQDLQFLESLTDEYVLSNIHTNEYISPSENTELFNEICETFLKEHSKLERVEYSDEQLISNLSFQITSTINDDKGHWECTSCKREWSACIGDDEVPLVCPDCSHDVDVINVRELDEKLQDNFSGKWAVQHSNGNTVSFDTEYLACDYQKQYRKFAGLNIDTGENI